VRQLARIWVLALLAAACATPPPPVDREPDAWLPLVPGSRWVYDVERRDASGAAPVEDLRVEGIERIADGLLWQVYDGDVVGLDPLWPAGASLELLRRGPGAFETGLRRPDGAAGFASRPHAAARLLFPIDPRPGQRWTRAVELDGVPAKLRVEVVGFEDVTAPAGLFRRCLALRLAAGAELPATGAAPAARLRFEGRVWYAPSRHPMASARPSA
jgi:hypothetical protein